MFICGVSWFLFYASTLSVFADLSVPLLYGHCVLQGATGLAALLTFVVGQSEAVSVCREAVCRRHRSQPNHGEPNPQKPNQSLNHFVTHRATDLLDVRHVTVMPSDRLEATKHLSEKDDNKARHSTFPVAEDSTAASSSTGGGGRIKHPTSQGVIHFLTKTAPGGGGGGGVASSSDAIAEEGRSDSAQHTCV